MFLDFVEKQILTASFFASLVSGLITSLVFLFIILFIFRPRISISPQMAKATDGFDPEHRTCWAIKIINRSYFSTFDMKIELSKKFAFPGQNNLQNFRITSIPLVKDHYPYVAPFRPQWWKRGYTDYGVRFRTYENLDVMLNGGTSTIEVRIICRHALTGLGSVFIYDYTQHAVKSGIFDSGNSFNISRVENT